MASVTENDSEVGCRMTVEDAMTRKLTWGTKNPTRCLGPKNWRSKEMLDQKDNAFRLPGLNTSLEICQLRKESLTGLKTPESGVRSPEPRQELLAVG